MASHPVALHPGYIKTGPKSSASVTVMFIVVLLVNPPESLIQKDGRKKRKRKYQIVLMNNKNNNNVNKTSVQMCPVFIQSRLGSHCVLIVFSVFVSYS